MSTYAIGDIQGCMEPLRCLLKAIKFDTQKDRLWIAGDLVNRGPDSLAVLRFLYQIRTTVTLVLGNHDLHFLAIALGHRKTSNADTLDELLQAGDREELTHWLLQSELLHHDQQLGFTMVHAGIPPQWTLAEAETYAREVEAILHSAQRDNFLARMYGNMPAIWHNELKGEDRWRIITNYFTRMRFCTAEGEIELKTKSAALDAPPGFLPWFAHAERKTKNNKIIFGHWAALEGKANTDNIYALDTGCAWGGSLTALRLEDEKYFSCKCDNTHS